MLKARDDVMRVCKSARTKGRTGVGWCRIKNRVA
jgi:hypothetical protein